MVPGDTFALLRCNSQIELWKVLKSTLELVKTISSEIDDAIGLVPLDDSTVLCYGASGVTKAHHLLDESSSSLENVSSLFQVRGPLERAAFKDGFFACGGRQNDLQVWDIATGTRTWSAKNVPHDEVRLAVPIWITDVSFFTTDSVGGSNIIATGTAHKHVRLYDVRTKRQPIFSWEVGDYRVTRVLPLSPYSADGVASVCITDSGGSMHIRDMRTGRVTTSYGSAGGSIRAAELGGDDVIASVSLDRYLRLHEVGKSALVFKAYLKNRLSCCLCMPGGAVNGERRSHSVDSEYDESSIGDADVIQSYVDSDEEEEDFDGEGSSGNSSASEDAGLLDATGGDESGAGDSSSLDDASSSSESDDQDEENDSLVSGSDKPNKRVVESVHAIGSTSKHNAKIVASKSKKRKLH